MGIRRIQIGTQTRGEGMPFGVQGRVGNRGIEQFDFGRNLFYEPTKVSKMTEDCVLQIN